MKIRFYCYNCGETFNISDRYLVNKDTVICPNCSLKLNDQSFVSLKHAVENIAEAHKSNDSNQRLEFNIIDDNTY